MELFRKCVVLFFLGFIVDLTQTIHIQACAEREIIKSVSTIIAIYMVGFWGHDWFVKYKTAFARWMLTASGAFGAGFGTGAAIYFGG